MTWAGFHTKPAQVGVRAARRFATTTGKPSLRVVFFDSQKQANWHARGFLVFHPYTACARNKVPPRPK
jgi:hypothetical protein